MKKILILSSSPRKGGNSDLLCDQFAKGAMEVGHCVEKVRICEKKIGYCRGCYACQKTGSCVQRDDAAEVIKKMLETDIIVFATPVYFYTMCAQLKALIDRTVCVFPEIKNKEYYYIMTMAETDEKMLVGTIEALRGFLACYDGSKECGIISATGVYEIGEVKNNPAFEQAYNVGKSI